MRRKRTNGYRISKRGCSRSTARCRSARFGGRSMRNVGAVMTCSSRSCKELPAAAPDASRKSVPVKVVPARADLCESCR